MNYNNGYMDQYREKLAVEEALREIEAQKQAAYELYYGAVKQAAYAQELYKQAMDNGLGQPLDQISELSNDESAAITEMAKGIASGHIDPAAMWQFMEQARRNRSAGIQ